MEWVALRERLIGVGGIYKLPDRVRRGAIDFLTATTMEEGGKPRVHVFAVKEEVSSPPVNERLN